MFHIKIQLQNIFQIRRYQFNIVHSSYTMYPVLCCRGCSRLSPCILSLVDPSNIWFFSIALVVLLLWHKLFGFSCLEYVLSVSILWSPFPWRLSSVNMQRNLFVKLLISFIYFCTAFQMVYSDGVKLYAIFSCFF